ncbi:MAG: ABC transporter substrate-binding protein [Epsilonproteobacteria bacterium]|nr:ABC transporter substrate-binding protein [Campylobacterota bacterium]
MSKHYLSRFLKIVCVSAMLYGGSLMAIQRGGTLTLSQGAPVKSLDPHKVISGDSYPATFNIFSTLTRITPQLTAEPELATSWSHDAKAIRWTFHLNKKAKFTNGRDVTAQDVKFSLDRVLDKTQSPRGFSKIGPIKEVIVKDKHTVVIVLTKSYLDLPVDLGSVYPRIIAKENLKDINTKPIGSGPFMLKKWTPGGVTVLVRNPHYFLMGKDGKALPYLDTIKIVPIKENTSALAAMEDGSVDMIYRIKFDLIPAVKRDKNLVLVGGTTPGYQPFVLNQNPVIHAGQDAAKARIFRNPKIREAFSYIMNRKALLQIALSGYGSIGNDQPIPPFSPYANKNIKPKKQNIPLAKKLLAEAGVKPGTHFLLYTSAGRVGLVAAATAFQQMAKKAGIIIDIKLIDIATYWSDIEYKVPFMIGNWGGRGTINASLKPYYITGGSSNDSLYSNPELDKLLNQGESESNFKKRKAIYAKAEKIISDAAVTLIPYYKDAYGVVTSKVHGAIFHPLTYWYADKLWKSK